ncbi:hypothetical protein [Candidatus Villigracilis affinis]|nr:hypothetical protein [Anaerolineales bacterium]
MAKGKEAKRQARQSLDDFLNWFTEVIDAWASTHITWLAILAVSQAPTTP